MSGKPLKDPVDLLDIASVLTDEEREIQATVAKFLADRVRPHIGEWFENAHFARELASEPGKLGVIGAARSCTRRSRRRGRGRRSAARRGKC
ncbi:acyl-CoA dehydrogenase family protein [Streptomyces sp. NPDC093598]|uniref:acyl-CoA dehydrogenase family protein n=1 Tax=Streptomyces sp. NPDC093598 TaxID=3366046 RepID=UPI00382DB3A0